MLIHSYRSFQFSPKPTKVFNKNMIDADKLSGTNQLRADIMQEMISIDKHMHKITSESSSADFSTRQTWKEMMGTRRHLLRRLAVSID